MIGLRTNSPEILAIQTINSLAGIILSAAVFPAQRRISASVTCAGARSIGPREKTRALRMTP